MLALAVFVSLAVPIACFAYFFWCLCWEPQSVLVQDNNRTDVDAYLAQSLLTGIDHPQPYTLLAEDSYKFAHVPPISAEVCILDDFRRRKRPAMKTPA